MNAILTEIAEQFGGEEELEKVVDQVAEEFAALTALELSTKKWSELEAIEHQDRLLFPEHLNRRRANGTFEQVPIMLRIPRDPEMRDARKRCKIIAARTDIDPKADVDLYSQLDNVCVLWHAVRNTSAPYEPLYGDPEEFERTYDRATMAQLWGKLEGYRRANDPRPSALSRDQLFALIASIAEGKKITPLLAFDSASQAAFIIFMASLLAILTTRRSSSEPSAPSTPES